MERVERNGEKGKNTYRGRASSILRSADIALYSVNPPLQPIKSARIAKKSWKDGDKKRRGNRKRDGKVDGVPGTSTFLQRPIPVPLDQTTGERP